MLDDPELTQKMYKITKDLTAQIYKVAFDGHSLANECDRGVVNVHRIWWVQAETVIGFLNGYEKEPEKKEYLEAACALSSQQSSREGMGVYLRPCDR